MPRIYKVSMNGDFGDWDGRSYWTRRKSELPTLRRRLKEENLDRETQPEPVAEAVDFLMTIDSVLEMLAKHADRG